MAGFLFSFITLGTNLIKFSSNPNQMRGHELLDNTAKEPIKTPIIITLTKIKLILVIKSYMPEAIRVNLGPHMLTRI